MHKDQDVDSLAKHKFYQSFSFVIIFFLFFSLFFFPTLCLVSFLSFFPFGKYSRQTCQTSSICNCKGPYFRFNKNLIQIHLRIPLAHITFICKSHTSYTTYHIILTPNELSWLWFSTSMENLILQAV
jgi:hypothetical protein